MMKNKYEVYQRALESRVVAILRKFDTTFAVEVGKALLAGGVKTMEVTMDTPGALEAISALRAELGDAVAVGAGTVLDSETGRAALLAGAQFLVAPNLNVELIKLGSRYNRLVIPGVFSPTEIEQAYEAGADIIKLFPAATAGSGYIKAVKGPLDHITLMATGGIGVENAKEFRNAGADLLGVGGKLVDNDLIKARKFDQITEYAAQLVEQAR